jgi:hypothetical protein
MDIPAPILSTPPIPIIPEKPKPNYWKISTLILALAMIAGGIFYSLNAKKLPPSSSPKPSVDLTLVQPSTEPIPTDSKTINSKHIVLGGIIMNYPDEWTAIFAAPEEGKRYLYFAKDEQEAQALSGCAATDCTGYSLRLEDISDYSVWENTTMEDFIKQVKKDIPFDSLQKTAIAGRDAWLGYTDEKKTKHEAIIDTSSALSKSLTVVTTSTTNPDGGLLEKYVSLSPSMIKIKENKSLNPQEITPQKGYAIELKSSLPTNDFWVLTFALQSLLAPENNTKNYQYSLYVEAGVNSQNGPSGPAYPGGNLLNAKYYLLTDNDQLKDGTYGTSQVQIKLSTPATANMGQFLADPKYCRQDSDCDYRSNFCTIGAFNPYHQFVTPWGCGPADLEGLGNTMELQERLGCGDGIDVEAKYDSLQCVNNSCQMVNAKPVCKQS